MQSGIHDIYWRVSSVFDRFAHFVERKRLRFRFKPLSPFGAQRPRFVAIAVDNAYQYIIVISYDLALVGFVGYLARRLRLMIRL